MFSYYFLMLSHLTLATVQESSIFNDYLKLQESLAADNIKDSQKAWSEICTQNIKKIDKVYYEKNCQKPVPQIDEIRERFKTLSEIYIKIFQGQKNDKIKIAYCPMANARWLQRNGEIANPYYGSKMLRCGEFE